MPVPFAACERRNQRGHWVAPWLVTMRPRPGMEQHAVRVKTRDGKAACDGANLGKLAAPLFPFPENRQAAVSPAANQIAFGIHHRQPWHAIRFQIERHPNRLLGLAFGARRDWPSSYRPQPGALHLTGERNLHPSHMIVLLPICLEDHELSRLAGAHIRNHGEYFIVGFAKLALGRGYGPVFVYIDAMKPHRLSIVGREQHRDRPLRGEGARREHRFRSQRDGPWFGRAASLLHRQTGERRSRVALSSGQEYSMAAVGKP